MTRTITLASLDRETLTGAVLLDQIRATTKRYVIFPNAEAADAVTLYIAATHAQTAWRTASRLVIKSAEKRCGKTRLLEVCRELVWNRLATGNISAAALVRSITEDNPPTILMDEADRIFGADKPSESTEILTGILNMGFARGWPYMRWNVQRNEREDCPTFAMAVLASKGVNLPDTVEDRAVVVVLRRRMPGEQVAEFRERDKAALLDLRAQIQRWVRPNLARLADAEPEMPVTDRAADVWESLTAIADLAGGDWPARARKAARLFTDEAELADAEQSTGIRLLADIRDTFDSMAVSFLESKVLLQHLLAIEDAPWSDITLTTRGLSDKLKMFGVKPGRNTTGAARGYRRESFLDPFARYLPAACPPVSRQNVSETVSHGSDQPEPTEMSGFPASGEASESVRNRQTLGEVSDDIRRSNGHLTRSDGFGHLGGAHEGWPTEEPPDDGGPWQWPAGSAGAEANE
jgi:hypothetical protein